MQREKLIEKQAAKLSRQISRPISSGSPAPAPSPTPAARGLAAICVRRIARRAFLLWDRTRGGIKMCFGINASNQKLVTVRPDLKSIRISSRPTASRCRRSDLAAAIYL